MIMLVSEVLLQMELVLESSVAQPALELRFNAALELDVPHQMVLSFVVVAALYAYVASIFVDKVLVNTCKKTEVN